MKTTSLHLQLAAAALVAISSTMTVSTVNAAAGISAADVWSPAPMPEEPPFICDFQPLTMIKAVGTDKVCIERGQAICRDNGGALGKWAFGLDKDDGNVTLLDPDGNALYNEFPGADSLCITNIDQKALHKPWYRNRNLRSSPEQQEQEQRELGNKYPTEPFLAIYGGGRILAELICKDVGNDGVASQLKMTDLRGYDLETEGFGFLATKFKRGQLADNDGNALWGIQIDHTYVPISLQKVEPVIVAKMVFDEDRCHWIDRTVPPATPAPTMGTTVSRAPTPAPRQKGEKCSEFKPCDTTTDPSDPSDRSLYCDFDADEEGYDKKKSKYHEPVSDSAYYSPFNIFGVCLECKVASTDIYKTESCTNMDGECCAGATCGALYHGGPDVCRPDCGLKEELCYSNENCCDGHCYIPKTGPGEAGIGFCVPEH